MLANGSQGAWRMSSVDWSTSKSTRPGFEGKVPVSENKYLPSFAGLTDHEQLMGADTLLQGPHLQGQSLTSRAMASGSLHVQRCTGNTGYPQPLKWAKPGVSLREWACSVRGGVSEEPGGRQSPCTPLAPSGNSHSFSPSPCCLCSPLQLFSKVLGAIFWKHWVYLIFFQSPFVTK